jgi:hypothetical protein
MCYIFSVSRKIATMSSESPSTQYYERIKKSRCDVDASKGSSREALLRRSTRETTHKDLPRGPSIQKLKKKRSLWFSQVMTLMWRMRHIGSFLGQLGELSLSMMIRTWMVLMR